MAKGRRIRKKGKLSLMRYFQKFSPGDLVAVIRDLSVKFGYSRRVQGRTGKVIKKQGSAYDVEINDHNKPKRYFIKPVHLQKIKA